jgi:hypothetical protein
MSPEQNDPTGTLMLAATIANAEPDTSEPEILTPRMVAVASDPEADSVLDAHFRRQREGVAEWVRGPSEIERKRIAHIDAMEALVQRNRLEREAAAAAKAEREEREAAAERIEGYRAEIADAEVLIKNRKAEIARLSKFLKG